MTMETGGLGIAEIHSVEPIARVHSLATVGSALESGPELYTAVDRRLDRPVAVRMGSPTSSESERQGFLEQAQRLAGLSSHPAITTVYDVGFTSDGRPYVIRELVEGPSLTRWLEDAGPAPWPRAVELTLQICSGLAEAHRGGTFHRDLRPDNILVTESGLKLTDVGLIAGRWIADDDPRTLVHRAPETFDGDWDERSDLYSLTSILYQLIEGQACHWRPNDTTEALRARLQTQSAPPLDPDLVPQSLRMFVTAGLSPDPLDRPQSATEFARELELIAQGRTTGATQSIPHTGGIPAIPSPPVSPTRSPSAIPPLPEETPLAATATRSDLDWPDLRPPPDESLRRGLVEADHTAVQPLAELQATQTSAEQAAISGVAADYGVSPPEHPTRTSPLFLGAMAVAALGLLSLAVLAFVQLRGSDSGESAGPVLPEADTQVAIEAGPSDGSSDEELVPLAMIEPSTTTTFAPVDPSMVTEPEAQNAVVPNLVGLDVEAAGQLLEEAGFGVLVVGRVSAGSTPGTVIDQTPAAGSSVPLPLSVTIYIPRSATLPFMVGRPAQTVCLQLAALGLECQQILVFNDQVPAGAVISSDPVEGSAFTEGQTIQLQVSRGPVVEIAVPELVGRSEEEARAALTELGFLTISVTNEASDSVPAGQTIGTNPAAGTNLATDQPVTIRLSAGPPTMATVPEVMTLGQAEATAALEGAGLAVAVVSQELPADDPNIGKVTAVDPAGGSQVAAGSTVTITVGQAPAEDSTQP